MSTDISVAFMNHYLDVLRLFDQRHVPNYFLFVPLVDAGPNETDAILNHNFADGIVYNIIYTKLHTRI